MSEIWGMALASVAAAGIGGAISSSGAKSAANSTNAANQVIADQTNQTNWNQYLLSRGISTGDLAGVPAGQVNTVLPLGFTINGKPAENELMNRIFAASGQGAKYSDPSYVTSPENISAYLNANPDKRTMLTQYLSDQKDGRSVEQWVSDHIKETGDTSYLAGLQSTAQAAQTQYQQSLQLSPQYQKLMTYGPQTLDQLYSGDFLAKQQQAQTGVADARNTLAGTVQQGIDEQRLKYGNLNTGQLSDLDRILSAGTTGSKGIYDAALTSADTYANSVKQATADELQRQQASRTLQGFIGQGSGDSLLRARTLASGYQAAAGARAQAGVDQATRLYGINTTDATSRFNVNTDYMKALATLLDSNGAAAKAQAGLQNNTDSAAIISNDLATRLATINQPGQLVTQGLGINQQQAQSPYNDINSLLSALSFFKQGQPATPGTQAPGYTTPVSNGQILGGAVSSVGSGLSQYYQNQQLINALKGINGGSTPPLGVTASDGGQI